MSVCVRGKSAGNRHAISAALLLVDPPSGCNRLRLQVSLDQIRPLDSALDRQYSRFNIEFNYAIHSAHVHKHRLRGELLATCRVAAARNRDYFSSLFSSLDERLNFLSGARLLDAINPRRIPGSMNIIDKGAALRLQPGSGEQGRSR